MRAITLFFILALLTACAGKTVAPSDAALELEKYHWHLTDLEQRPANEVEAKTNLRFLDGEVLISGLCNFVSGSAVIRDHNITFGRMRSTMKACSDQALMAHENAFPKWLQNVERWALEHHPQSPTLTLSQASGKTITLRGEPTLEKRFGSSGEMLFLEIQPSKVTCHHPLIENFQCLKVRRITYNEAGIKSSAGDWENFYDTIEGYENRDNVRTVLRLKRYTRNTPPADASRYVYVHDLTVEQELISP